MRTCYAVVAQPGTAQFGKTKRKPGNQVSSELVPARVSQFKTTFTSAHRRLRASIRLRKTWEKARCKNHYFCASESKLMEVWATASFFYYCVFFYLQKI